KPIPLDLLSLLKFTDYPTNRRSSSRNHRSAPSTASASSNSGGQSDNGDPQVIYPLTIHHNGRQHGGSLTFYTDSATHRVEWRQKLDEAIGLRKVVQDANKVFEIETLSTHTFTVPPVTYPLTPSTWNENSITGRVTCSIPFNTPDGRRLVAVGCAEGIWIGFRRDSSSMRRVLHL
ncbi:Rho1 guanine nucleotide exchange factor 1, partial [Termitomyces sp. T112]